MRNGVLSRAGRVLVVVGLVWAGELATTSEVEAGWQARRSPDPKIRVIPQLEVEQLGKEFSTWGRDIVIYQPGVLKFRWNKPAGSALFTWKVYRGSAAPQNWVKTLTLPCPAAAGLHQFSVNLKGALPLYPPEQPAT